MKKKYMIFLMTLCFWPCHVWANLTLSSFYVLFDANSPKRAQVVRLTNSSNSSKTYRISFINYKQKADGTYEEITEPVTGNPFASSYIGFSPHETTLAPAQTQTIRMALKPMAAAANGEYVSHLMIRELPDKTPSQLQDDTGNLKIDIKALYGVTIPVIIDKGELHSSAVISAISSGVEKEKPYVTVRVKRTGNQFFWGNLIVKKGEKELGRVNGFKIFMTTPERNIKIPLSEKIVSGGQVILEDVRSHETISAKSL